MSRWGMVVDLKRCMGCYSCVVGCKQEQFVPPNMFWTRLLTSEKGEFPQIRNQVFPVLCNHCKEAPCVKICPTGASEQRKDGIVTIDGDKCIGCGYCMIACPYHQRTMYENDREEYFPGQGLTEFELIGRELNPLPPKTILKCNFCKDKIDSGILKGLKPGSDREATPACVNNCPVRARTFGDLDDPNGRLSILIRERKGFQLRPDFGTEPSVFYLD